MAGINMSTTRREFIKNTSLTTAAAATLGGTFLETTLAEAAPAVSLNTPASVKRGDMFYRKLGRTGEEVSLIGLGGFHIGKQATESESIRIIDAAIDGGITFMDNCWDYNDGTSEVRMGKALRGKRDKVFLMSKIDGRTKASAARQIDESLLRLDTDHIDLMQFHEIIRLEDPDRIFAKGGAHEAMMEAKKAGKIRHIGFTGHKDPIVHLRMLDIAAQHGLKFDTVQMPINVMDAHFRSFAHDVLPRLVKEKTGVLAMKTFGDHFILDHVLKSGTATPIELLHYSMSQPVSVVITGIDSLKVLNQALEAARTFKPMTSAQKSALLQKMKVAAADGHLEKFKTTPKFDGTAQNPKWLG
jgi:aryl-alcohol dehydrogenase-like predicted oxidoreductase